MRALAFTILRIERARQARRGSRAFQLAFGSCCCCSMTTAALGCEPLDPAVVLADFKDIPSPTISAVLNGMGIRAWLSGGTAPGCARSSLSR